MQVFRLRGRQDPLVRGCIGTAVEVTGIPRPGKDSSVITKSASQSPRQALRQLLSSRATMTSCRHVSHLITFHLLALWQVDRSLLPEMLSYFVLDSPTSWLPSLLSTPLASHYFLCWLLFLTAYCAQTASSGFSSALLLRCSLPVPWLKCDPYPHVSQFTFLVFTLLWISGIRVQRLPWFLHLSASLAPRL